MKTIFTKDIIVYLSLLLSGCSGISESSYTTLHQIEKRKCDNNPNLEERQQCIDAHTQIYNPYSTTETR